MRQIKTTTTDYLFQSILYLISALCCTLLLLFSQSWEDSHQGWTDCRLNLKHGEVSSGSRAQQKTHGWRLSLPLLPFPSQISFDEFGCHEHRFLDVPSYLLELFGNFKAFWFTVRLRGKAVRPWVGIPNRQSHGQTVRVGRSDIHSVVMLVWYGQIRGHMYCITSLVNYVSVAYQAWSWVDKTQLSPT